jgi:hypothetical protein
MTPLETSQATLGHDVAVATSHRFPFSSPSGEFFGGHTKNSVVAVPAWFRSHGQFEPEGTAASTKIRNLFINFGESPNPEMLEGLGHPGGGF